MTRPAEALVAWALLPLALIEGPTIAVAQKPPVIGPFNTTSAIYAVDALDSSRREAWVVWPKSNDTKQTFPLLTYLHGAAGGGIDLFGYTELFIQLASYGFIVAAPFSCDAGCKDASHDPRWTSCLPGLPPVGGTAWAPWYAEGLKTIDWARNMTGNVSSDPVFHLIDWGVGVGLVGHSMGGQATAVSLTASCTSAWGIKAAALHHPEQGNTPWGNIGVNFSVPVAGFVSSGDHTCPPPQTEGYMNATRVRPAAYRNLEGWSHLEPVLWPPVENPLLATFTAAWFKVTLTGDRGAWYDMTFGKGSDTLCGETPMVACWADPGPGKV